MWEKSSVFEILTEILHGLSEEDLKKFQNHLISRDDEKKISRRYLEEVSREKTIEVMISHFQCSGALDVTRETLDGIRKNDLAQKLMKKAEALQAPGQRREPKGREIGKGVIQVAAGVVIGAGSVAAAGAVPQGAVLAVPLAGAVFGGYLIVGGIRSLSRKVKDV